MTINEYLKLIDAVNEKGKHKPDWTSLSHHKTPECYSRKMYWEGTNEYKHHIESVEL